MNFLFPSHFTSFLMYCCHRWWQWAFLQAVGGHVFVAICRCPYDTVRQTASPKANLPFSLHFFSFFVNLTFNCTFWHNLIFIVLQKNRAKMHSTFGLAIINLGRLNLKGSVSWVELIKCFHSFGGPLSLQSFAMSTDLICIVQCTFCALCKLYFMLI